MKQLLEDVLEVLNAMPNRKLRGKDWTTYDLAKRVEEAIIKTDIQEKLLLVNISLSEHLQESIAKLSNNEQTT